MSLISDYEQRTAWKHKPIHGRFATHVDLRRKVNQDGSYAPFLGSTVVFRPEERCVHAVERLQKCLTRDLTDTGMLAQPLGPETIHMTLHDLLSPDNAGGDGYEQLVEDSLARAAEMGRDIRHQFPKGQIRMKTDRIVNMVSKSLVLMLRPVEETDYELLMDLYWRFDEIVPLSYPLTPHITLAYFRPGLLDGDRLGMAVNRAQQLLDDGQRFAFSTSQLTAQRFLDMRTYADVM